MADGDLLCGGCGYNLRGVPSDRCPECGRHFDAGHLVSDLIPWEQRKYIGRVRAFWRTAWIASFRPKQFAAKLDRPVSRSAARGFHACVVVLVLATGVIAGITMTRLSPELLQFRSARTPDEPQIWYMLLDRWSAMVTFAALAIWLALLTPISARYFDSPQLPVERRNRALAMSGYGAAPLVWIALAVVTASIAALVLWGGRGAIRPEEGVVLLAQLACGIAILIGVSWLLRRRRGAPRSPALDWSAGIVAVALGGTGIALAWIKVPVYTKVITPPLAAAMGWIGLACLLTPLAWWWLVVVRLMSLSRGDAKSRSIAAAGGMMLMWWLVSLVAILATAHAVYFMVAMLMAW